MRHGHSHQAIEARIVDFEGEERRDRGDHVMAGGLDRNAGLLAADSSGGDEEILASLPGTAIRWLQKSGIHLKQTRLILNDAISNDGKPTTWALIPFEMSIK